MTYAVTTSLFPSHTPDWGARGKKKVTRELLDKTERLSDIWQADKQSLKSVTRCDCFDTLASNITTPSLASLTNLTLQGRQHIDVCKKAASTTGAKELKGRIGNKREVTRSQHLRATRSALCQKKSVASGKLGGRALRCNCEPFTSSNLSNNYCNCWLHSKQLTIAIDDCILSN